MGIQKTISIIIIIALIATISLPYVSASIPLYGAGRPTFLYKPDYTSLDLTAMMTKFNESGSNTFRVAMYDLSDPYNVYYQTINTFCQANSINLVIQTLMTNPADEHNIIHDVGTYQDDWIGRWEAIIDVLHPYAIMVMNEPSNDGTYVTASSSEFTAYRTFCENSIDAYRAVDANIKIIVNNDPFNDDFTSTSYGFSATPIARTDIYYGLHYYYCYDGSYPSWQPNLQYYWAGQTAEGKAATSTFLDEFFGSVPNPIVDEWGANPTAYHATDFTTDFIDLLNTKSISSIYYAYLPYGTGYAQEDVGILNNDYTVYNAVGVIWANYNALTPETTTAPVATPTPNGMINQAFAMVVPLAIVIIASYFGWKFARGWGFFAGVNAGVIICYVFNYLPLWSIPLMIIVDGALIFGKISLGDT